MPNHQIPSIEQIQYAVRHYERLRRHADGTGASALSDREREALELGRQLHDPTQPLEPLSIEEVLMSLGQAGEDPTIERAEALHKHLAGSPVAQGICREFATLQAILQARAETTITTQDTILMVKVRAAVPDTQLDPEDALVAGDYPITVKAGLTLAKSASVALDQFHRDIPIANLDSFDIEVADEHGFPVPEDPDHEGYSGDPRADVEDFKQLAMDSLLAHLEREQSAFADRGMPKTADQFAQVRSFLEQFGLPHARNQLALIKAVMHTTDQLRAVFRAGCEQLAFRRGSDCDNKLQAICEGDIALVTVGERDTVWTPEKATVARRQGWELLKSQDGSMRVEVVAAQPQRPGAPQVFATDTEAYAHICKQAKEGDLLALSACRQAGIQLAVANDYRPPVLDI